MRVLGYLAGLLQVVSVFLGMEPRLLFRALFQLDLQ